MADASQEEWRPVVGYEGVYSISSMGRVRREIGFRVKAARILINTMNPFGYVVVRLSVNGIAKLAFVHRLVATAFIGPKASGHDVNHKNGNRSDARLANLEYLTHLQNVRYSIEVLGTQLVGSAHSNSKITEDDVRAIRSLRSQGLPYRSIGRRFGIHGGTARKINMRLTWKHVA